MADLHALVVIVERGQAEHIVDKAKEQGAGGATIFYGRGTGQEEFSRFFHHLQVDSSKEIILIVVPDDQLQSIMKTVVEAGKLMEPGKGIAFTLPVSNLVGLAFRDRIKEPKTNI